MAICMQFHVSQINTTTVLKYSVISLYLHVKFYSAWKIFRYFIKQTIGLLLTGCSLGREVDETDDNTLSVECVNSPRSRLVTAPATECFRVLPSSAEVDDVLWTARYRHLAVACLRRH